MVEINVSLKERITITMVYIKKSIKQCEEVLVELRSLKGLWL